MMFRCRTAKLAHGLRYARRAQCWQRFLCNRSNCANDLCTRQAPSCAQVAGHSDHLRKAGPYVSHAAWLRTQKLEVSPRPFCSHPRPSFLDEMWECQVLGEGLPTPWDDLDAITRVLGWPQAPDNPGALLCMAAIRKGPLWLRMPADILRPVESLCEVEQRCAMRTLLDEAPGCPYSRGCGKYKIQNVPHESHGKAPHRAQRQCHEFFFYLNSGSRRAQRHVMSCQFCFLFQSVTPFLISRHVLLRGIMSRHVMSFHVIVFVFL